MPAIAAHGASSRSRDPRLGRDSLGIAFGSQTRDRVELQISLEYGPDDFGFNLVDDELAIPRVVAKGRHATPEDAFRARSCGLVPNALGGDLALELSKGEQPIECQAAHGGRRDE